MKKVIVASTNPVKIQVAERVFTTMFPDETFECIGVKSISGVPDQPFDDETYQGAQNRLAFIKEQHPDADYWISQEGGLCREGTRMYNRAWILIQDAEGFIGKSSTASFYIPTQVAAYVNEGDELGVADDKYFNMQNSKQGKGGIDLVTHGKISRADYYVQAGIIALGQIIGKDWFTDAD